MEGIFGIKSHYSCGEYVNLEMALKRELFLREANLTQQIERIKRENQERENRL